MRGLITRTTDSIITKLMIFIFLVYVLAHHVTNNLGCYNKYRKNADILPEKDIGPREGMKIERKKKERKII